MDTSEVYCDECSSPLYPLEEEEFSFYCLQCGVGKNQPASHPEKILQPTEKKSPKRKLNEMPGRSEKRVLKRPPSDMPPPVKIDSSAHLSSEEAPVLKAPPEEEDIDLFNHDNPEEFFHIEPVPEEPSPVEVSSDYEVKETQSTEEKPSYDYQDVTFGEDKLAGVETAEGFGELERDQNHKDFRDRSKLPTALLSLIVIALAGLVAFLGRVAWESMKKDTAAQEEVEKSLTEITEIHKQEAEKEAQAFFRARDLDMIRLKVLPDKSIISSMLNYWSEVKDSPALELIDSKLIDTPDGNHAVFHFQHPLDERFQRNTYLYMNADNQFYFDWRTYAGIQDVRLDDIKALKEGTDYLIRGIPGRARHAHSDINREDYQAYKLIVPECGISAESNVYGYIEKREAELHVMTLKTLDKMLLMKATWNGEVFLISEILSDTPSEYAFLNLSSLFREEE